MRERDATGDACFISPPAPLALRPYSGSPPDFGLIGGPTWLIGDAQSVGAGCRERYPDFEAHPLSSSLLCARKQAARNAPVELPSWYSAIKTKAKKEIPEQKRATLSLRSLVPPRAQWAAGTWESWNILSSPTGRSEMTTKGTVRKPSGGGEKFQPTTSLRYCTNATKFSNAPSARLRNSGNFLRSIFFVCSTPSQTAHHQYVETPKHDRVGRQLTAARTPGTASSSRSRKPFWRKTGTSHGASSSEYRSMMESIAWRRTSGVGARGEGDLPCGRRLRRKRPIVYVRKKSVEGGGRRRGCGEGGGDAPRFRRE